MALVRTIISMVVGAGLMAATALPVSAPAAAVPGLAAAGLSAPGLGYHNPGNAMAASIGAAGPSGTAAGRTSAGVSLPGSTKEVALSGPGVEHYSWGQAIPLSVEGPKWFDSAMYEKVLAAGDRGVPLSSINMAGGGNAPGGSNPCLYSSGVGPTSGTVPSTPAGVERPPVRWRLRQPPVFDNVVATLRLEGPSASMRLQRARPDGQGRNATLDVAFEGALTPA